MDALTLIVEEVNKVKNTDIAGIEREIKGVADKQFSQLSESQQARYLRKQKELKMLYEYQENINTLLCEKALPAVENASVETPIEQNNDTSVRQGSQQDQMNTINHGVTSLRLEDTGTMISPNTASQNAYGSSSSSHSFFDHSSAGSTRTSGHPASATAMDSTSTTTQNGHSSSKQGSSTGGDHTNAQVKVRNLPGLIEYADCKIELNKILANLYSDKIYFIGHDGHNIGKTEFANITKHTRAGEDPARFMQGESKNFKTGSCKKTNTYTENTLFIPKYRPRDARPSEQLAAMSDESTSIATYTRTNPSSDSNMNTAKRAYSNSHYMFNTESSDHENKKLRTPDSDAQSMESKTL